MKELIEKLKTEIIKQVHLVGVNPNDINEDSPIFGDEGGGLGLDSIDALEIVALLDREFEIEVEDISEISESLASLKTLALFIEKKRAEKKNTTTELSSI